jgi:hypothetical protein
MYANDYRLQLVPNVSSFDGNFLI